MLVRNLIFDKTRIPLLNKALNVTSLRHRALSNNVANASTVNFKRKDVNFAAYLRSQVVKSKIAGTRTDDRHMLVGSAAQQAPRMYQPDTGPNTTGINNVDVDMEMANLAQNHLLYNVGARLLSGSFQGLRKSISGQVRG
ncbi:MAG: flagellar basal-body rod protein FlgB [Candidatus Latescibacterota bacterium]|jgi:flagellar basal-body rod protein FlgB